ncbi:hypothetical protein [Solimonas terrae]|uniref:Uncharacterized protein n=1 Tax=Solimonas terrae TaxID=1396819 RepID=A0A6M2BWC1_9GAMM|nr:hypothetical protein [Solimonas terrae]NGY06640.1 hypothetical protein [Solimonas terrae]
MKPSLKIVAQRRLPERPSLGKHELDVLDALDAAVAVHEGRTVASLNAAGLPIRPDGSPYRPTRDPGEAHRLMEKYVERMAKRPHAWIAIGANGRAEVGNTASIATCKVVVNSER